MLQKNLYAECHYAECRGTIKIAHYFAGYITERIIAADMYSTFRIFLQKKVLVLACNMKEYSFTSKKILPA